MSTAVAEQLFAQLKSLVPSGAASPAEAQIKQAQDVLRKLKVSSGGQQSGHPCSPHSVEILTAALSLI
jgi:hypothetical protein